MMTKGHVQALESILRYVYKVMQMKKQVSHDEFSQGNAFQNTMSLFADTYHVRPSVSMNRSSVFIVSSKHMNTQ